MTPGEVVPFRQAQLEQRAAALEAWTREQRDILKRVYGKDLTDSEFALFEQVCMHRQLDPFRGEIVAIKRDGRPSFEPSAEGYRTIADRTGLFAGMETFFCGPDRKWREEWIEDGPPKAAKTIVYRRDFVVPQRYVARYASYVQFTKSGSVTQIWKKSPDFMLQKCSETGALKRAFRDQDQMLGRELAPQSRMAMEAKAAGLDDDGRHALAYKVSGGRTDSTRELTDDEEFQFRASVAAAQACADMEAEAEAGMPEDVDPDTGEIVPSPQDEDQLRRDLIAECTTLAKELKASDPDRYVRFQDALNARGIGASTKPRDMDIEELRTVRTLLSPQRDLAVGHKAPEAALSGSPAQPTPLSGEGSQGEAGSTGNSVPAVTPAGPSWEQQIEAAAGDWALEWDDIAAVIEAATGRKVLKLEDVADDDRAGVLDALRKVAAGDLELDYSATAGASPRLVEAPF